MAKDLFKEIITLANGGRVIYSPKKEEAFRKLSEKTLLELENILKQHFNVHI